MWQTMLHRHPQTQAEYTLRLPQRSRPTRWPSCCAEVNAQLDHLCSAALHATTNSPTCGGLRFIKSDFVDFLRIFRFQRDFIEARADGEHAGDRRRAARRCT